MVSRYRDLDDDEARLPHGFQRVGYDADTQTYTYQSPEGELYVGEPGNRYGQLRRASQEAEVELDLEDIVQENKKAYRYFLPFLLLVIVFLLLVIAPPWKRNFGFGDTLKCDAGTKKHRIKSGETCYELAKTFSTSVDELRRLNSDLNCDTLQIGQQICVPLVEIS